MFAVVLLLLLLPALGFLLPGGQNRQNRQGKRHRNTETVTHTQWRRLVSGTTGIYCGGDRRRSLAKTLRMEVVRFNDVEVCRRLIWLTNAAGDVLVAS